MVLKPLAAEPIQFRGDRDRLLQVLTNYLSNAIKFSPPGGEVTIGVERLADDRVRFAVADRGPGIPKEKLGLLFGKFQQVDGSDTRAKGGTGLGLAISKAIVLEHGGAVEVASDVGQGATFAFTVGGAPRAQG